MIFIITLGVALLLLGIIEWRDKRAKRADKAPDPNPNSAVLKQKYGKPKQGGWRRFV
jgi:hypothetical protein